MAIPKRSAEAPKKTPHIPKAGELRPSLLRRLKGEKTGIGEETKINRNALNAEITSIFSNKKLTTGQRREKFGNVASKWEKPIEEGGVGKEDMFGVYGHMTVDRLQQTLNPDVVEDMKIEFKEVRSSFDSKAEDIMDKAYLDKGFYIPKTASEIQNIPEDHPYFCIVNGVLRVRADIVRKDMKYLNETILLDTHAIDRSNSMAAAASYTDRHVEILQGILNADSLSKIQTMPFAKKQRSPEDKEAINALLKLGGLLAAGLALLSYMTEKDGDGIPYFTLAYAGLAALAYNPKLLTGREGRIRGELEWLHSKEWDELTTNYKDDTTGEKGAKFFEAMTQNNSVYRLFTKLFGKDGNQNSGTDFVDSTDKFFLCISSTEEEKTAIHEKRKKNKLSPLVVSKELENMVSDKPTTEHAEFLRRLSDGNADLWKFLILKLGRVRSSDAKNLLVGIAREGVNMDTMWKPTNKPAQGTKAKAAAPKKDIVPPTASS